MGGADPFAGSGQALRGLKTVEYGSTELAEVRSRPTHVLGERFYIYAAGKKWSPDTPTGRGAPAAWSCDLAAVGGTHAPGGLEGPGGLPPWLAELADALRLYPHDLSDLPTGLIPRRLGTGSAVIERVTPGECVHQRWPADLPLAPGRRRARRRPPQARRRNGRPQPVWFRPF